MKRDESDRLFKEAEKRIPGGVNSPVRAFRAVKGLPFFAKSAKGAYVTDADDNTLLDYVGTWGPAILGHAHPRIINAVQQTADSGTSFGIPNRYENDLAKRVIDAVRSVKKVRMLNSGTEATMTAIRVARGFTRREKIIKFEGCYHGHVDSLLVKAGSGALTLGTPDSAGVPKSFTEHTIVLPFNDLQAVKDAFTEWGSNIAGIILEPIPANAGLFFPEEGFLEGLRELTTQHDSVLIFDEVMTGFRLGLGGAQNLLGVEPDLSCFGKIIGGGLPVGALGGKAEIMDCLAPLGPVYQAGTLSGNPLAMVAGISALDELSQTEAYALLEKLGAQLEEGMNDAAKRAGVDVFFNRVGSMFCGFFQKGPVRNLSDGAKSDLERFGRFFHGLLEKGIYLAPSQFEAGFISTAHTPEDIDKTINAAYETLKAF